MCTDNKQQRGKQMSNPPPTPPNNFPLSVRRGIHNDREITESEAKDSENDMWNICLGEVKEDDQRIADAWKGDADGILVFTGLFSATVGAFIIEFYKKLSPDSGDQTVALLGHISQQLANISDGIHSNGAIPGQQSPPSAAMVLVIAMWLISLVLSITSALIATLLQRWARRYVDTPKLQTNPNFRVRVRWFLKRGNDVYKTGFLVEVAATLIHLSVYLFFAGLVIVFHTINKKVATVVDVSVGVIGLAYLMLSILPCLDVKCPYRTPMSYILWYPCQIFLSFAACCLGLFVKRLRGYFVEPSPDGIIEGPWQLKLVNWSNSCGKAIRKHWRYLVDGFRESVLEGALDTLEGDHEIIDSLFSVLSLRDRSKLRNIAAGIPRYRIFDLIRPVESGKIGPLLALLRSCAGGTHATGPDEDVRKRALVTCLDAIHHVLETPDAPELNSVRTTIANIGLMRTLLDDSNTAIRVTSRSICAKIAKQLGRGWLEEGDLRWLEGVTGETSHDILNADVGARDWMNIKSFVYGALSNQDGALPPEDAISFKETLAILLDVGDDPHFDSPFSQNKLSQQVTRIHEGDPQGSSKVVKNLLSVFPFIPPPFPVPVI